MFYKWMVWQLLAGRNLSTITIKAIIMHHSLWLENKGLLKY